MIVPYGRHARRRWWQVIHPVDCSCRLGWERGYGLIVAPLLGEELCPTHREGKAPREDHLGRPVAP